MEYWEFLLQQEGDSNWLPLDTSQMEILEGRYRIMAHCSQPHALVKVHIGQLLSDQDPPRRRSLKRQGQTSDKGLMVVLPFTWLTPGTWDIYCQGVVDQEPDPPVAAAAPLPPPWHYAIQLRVLSQDVGEDGDWFADDGSSSSLAPDRSPPTADADFDSPEASPGLTPTGWPGLDLQQVAEGIDQAQVRLTDTGGDTDVLYTLELPQTALMAAHGQPIQITGRASSVMDGESCSDMALVVRLSDPQNAAVLTLTPFALTAPALPAPFSLTLALPESPSTRLLLGDLALVSWQGATVNLLALKRFTVTVDLAALFDEIANRAETEGEDDLVFAPDRLRAEPRPDQADDESDGALPIDFPVAPPRSLPTLTLPRSQTTIPPQIYYPSPHEVSAHTPVLPPLGKPKPAPEMPADAPQPKTPAPDDRAAPPGADLAEPVAPDPAAIASQPSPTAESAPQGLNLPPVAPKAPAADPVNGHPTQGQVPAAAGGHGESSAQPESRLLPSHEAMAFKALNLQDRFWHRLNDLAATIQQDAQQTGPVEADPQFGTALAEGDTAESPFIPFEGEVVIYEEESLPPEDLTPEQAAELVARLEQAPPPELLAPPQPDLDLTASELTAGDTVLLTLRVPYHANRLYLKVWITDPQTRSLADEPRQITHLAPDGRGQLEGTIQLTVPMGCLEAWFEAISVDMVTQQESYKTTVIRAVNPPGIAPQPLDEFEL